MAGQSGINPYEHAREVSVAHALARNGYHGISREVIRAVTNAVPKYFSSETTAEITRQVVERCRPRRGGG